MAWSGRWLGFPADLLPVATVVNIQLALLPDVPAATLPRAIWWGYVPPLRFEKHRGSRAQTTSGLHLVESGIKHVVTTGHGQMTAPAGGLRTSSPVPIPAHRRASAPLIVIAVDVRLGAKYFGLQALAAQKLRQGEGGVDTGVSHTFHLVVSDDIG